MTSEDIARLSLQHEEAFQYWKDLRRQKAQSWVIEDALERLNRLTKDLSDAVVMTMTERKTKKKSSEDTPVGN